ncbi:hypothetical protein, partial [Achromobacter phage kwar_LB4]
APCNEGTSD